MLVEYLAKKNVSVVHLVREASVLRLASMAVAQSANTWHSADAAAAAKEKAKSTPMSWGNQIRLEVTELERENDAWQQAFLAHPGIRYHYLRYEDLLSSELCDPAISGVAAFLGTSVSGSGCAKSNGGGHSLKKLHSTTCSSRMANYEELRAELNGTKTAAACDYLEDLVSQGLAK